MYNKILLPNRYKKIGWLLFIPFMLIGLMITIFDFQIDGLTFNTFAIFYDKENMSVGVLGIVNDNLTNEIVAVLFLTGALLVMFSKEKNEDEYIASIRLNALLWSVLVNYILLIFMFVFVYGFIFLNVMVYNMFTTLIIFIFRFNYILYKNSKLNINEK
jgi:hypothetical protein